MAATPDDGTSQAMTGGDIYTIADGGPGSGGFSGDGGPALAAQLSGPGGLAIDGAGNLVIADTNNQRIRVVAARGGTFYGIAMTAGDIYTVAGVSSPAGTAGFSGDGGPATSAELDDPQGVALGGAGNLLVTDMGNNRIRQVGG